MAWLTFMAESPVGSMIWLPLEDADSGDLHFAFVIREESDVIEKLSKWNKNVILPWRFGVMGIEIPSGKLVAIIDAIVKTPGGIMESTINVLHFTDETVELLKEGFVVLFVGDSGSVERTLIFPRPKEFLSIVDKAMDIFNEDPWDDDDFNQAKAYLESTTSVEELWKRMG
jgi:hypothetical protein